MFAQLFVLATISLAMAAFLIRELLHGRHVSARIQKQGSSPLLGQKPMEFAYWCLTPIGKAAAVLGLSPDVFSWSCFFLGLASGVLAAMGMVPLAGGVGIVGALFDTLDGMVARRRGVASDAGEVLDAAVDRYTEFFFLGGLCIYYRFEVWAMVLVLAALLGSLLVSYSQAKAEAMRIEHLIPKGWMRRPERAVYLNGSAFLSPLLLFWFEPNASTQTLHYPLLLAIALVAVFANVTTAQRFIVMYKHLKPKTK